MRVNCDRLLFALQSNCHLILPAYMADDVMQALWTAGATKDEMLRVVIVATTSTARSSGRRT
jgi:hypothetical protein